MAEPTLRKYPAEIFGLPYSDNSKEAKEIREAQICPFLNDVCKKPRKSDPNTKVGICTVGYKGNHTNDYSPVIICPHRLEMSIIKKTIKENYFPHVDSNEIYWLPEFHVTRTVGLFDYVAVHVEKRDNKTTINDFVCVELQAAGTTGTPWNAVLDHKKTGKFAKSSYNYGINWANEFAKTMMQQAYKKGLIVSSWNKKLVFVVQDIGLRYLEKNYDTSSLHSPKPGDPIEFCTLELVWDDANNRWTLQFVRRVSTDEDGVRKMLGGVNQEDYPTVDTVLTRIKDKIQNHRNQNSLEN